MFDAPILVGLLVTALAVTAAAVVCSSLTTRFWHTVSSPSPRPPAQLDSRMAIGPAGVPLRSRTDLTAHRGRSFELTIHHDRSPRPYIITMWQDSTARDILSQMPDELLKRWQLSRQYAVVLPGRTSWTHEKILPPETKMLQYANADLWMGDRRRVPPSVIDAEWVAERLPHIGQSARVKLLERLLPLTRDQLDFFSIGEKPNGVSEASGVASGLYGKLAIVHLDPIVPQDHIHFEGEYLYPYRLLPDDSGVELRSAYTYEYRAITEEDRLAPAPVESHIDQCKKLLHDLPIALRNSELAHAKSDESDLNTLGAMFLEQVRIREEIATQQARLVQLEEEAAVARQSRTSAMKPLQYQTTLTLPFGRTQVGDRTYELHRLQSPPDDALAGGPREVTTQELAIQVAGTTTEEGK